MKRFLEIAVTVMLYAVTWMGGWQSHATQLQAHAQELYDEGKEDEISRRAMEAEEVAGPFKSRLLPDGPKIEISRKVPVLPGGLIAKPCYAIGPLWAQKVVIYYGFGSVAIDTIFQWIS